MELRATLLGNYARNAHARNAHARNARARSHARNVHARAPLAMPDPHPHINSPPNTATTPQKSHVIPPGQFLTPPTNVAIPTTAF